MLELSMSKADGSNRVHTPLLRWEGSNAHLNSFYAALLRTQGSFIALTPECYSSKCSEFLMSSLLILLLAEVTLVKQKWCNLAVRELNTNKMAPQQYPCSRGIIARARKLVSILTAQALGCPSWLFTHWLFSVKSDSKVTYIVFILNWMSGAHLLSTSNEAKVKTTLPTRHSLQ